jgi:HEAT repeat protein
LFGLQVDVTGSEPLLVDTLGTTGSPMLRAAILQSLSKSGTAAAVPTLARAARDPKLAVTAIAVLQAIAARDVPEAKAALQSLGSPPRAPSG